MESVYTDKVMYRCMDSGVDHPVDPRCSYESAHVECSIKEMEMDQRVPDKSEIEEWGDWILGISLSSIPSDVSIPNHLLYLVEWFCLGRFSIFQEYGEDVNLSYLLEDKVQEFDSLFVQDKSVTVLVQLMDAAIELQIKSLFDLTRNVIADKIDGMSVKQILKIFNLPDFTHQVWDESLFEDWDCKELQMLSLQ